MQRKWEKFFRACWDRMCITMTNLTKSYKTLKYMGLNSTQATRCKELSNYQTFLDAGWTTGY